MSCSLGVQEERLEAYLLGRLEEGDCQDLEDHFFACPDCQGRLATLQALPAGLAARDGRPESRRPERRRRSTWAGAGLTLLAASLLLALLLRETPPAGGGGAGEGGTAEIPQERLVELARFAPPRYQPLVLRGATDPAFAAAMDLYLQGDFAAASAGLARLAADRPADPAVHFFLGASALLAGDTDAGLRALEAAVALGDSIYPEEARLLLARALIGQGRLGPAREQLAAVIALGGDFEAEARRLLGELDRLAPPRPPPTEAPP